MTREFGFLATLCLGAALCLALVGCGGAGADKSSYTGEWNLASSTDEDLDADSISLMKSIGIEASLTLNEDGTGMLDLFGEGRQVTWEASSNTEGKVVIDGSESPMKISDGELTLSDVNGSDMTFTR